MKKIVTVIISVLLAAFMLAGCTDKVAPLANVGGEVKSGNGSAVVEKGDYIYFINGKVSTSADNTFNKPVKGALMRIKTADLKDPSAATVETVVPKLMISGNYKTGVYMYGDFVYYVTPSVQKDKAGTLQYSKSEVYRFDLKKGKNAGSPVVTLDVDTQEYRFVKVGEKVYFLTTVSEKEKDSSVNKLVCYDTESGKQIFKSKAYQSIAMAEDNSGKVYYTVFGYTEATEVTEKFHDIYSYTAGDTKAELYKCGAGTQGYAEDKRKDVTAEQKYPADYTTGSNGVTVEFIKYTGNLLVIKLTSLDENIKPEPAYLGIDFSSGATDLKNLGFAGKNNIDDAFVSSSYFESLNAVYYVKSDGTLNKYDYANGDDDDTHGRVIVASECKSGDSALTLYGVRNGDMYFYSSDGYYFRCNFKASEVSVNKINAYAMQTPSDWYGVSVTGNYLIGSCTNDTYLGGYLYAVDMTGIFDAAEENKDKNAYAEKLEKIAEINRENILAVQKTLVGKYTDSDKTSFRKKLDENYPAEK